MKKFFLLGIMVCLAVVASAQRSMDWYSYWGSNEAGNQIDPQRMVVDRHGNIYVAATFGGTKVAVESTTLNSKSAADKGDAVIVKMSPSKEVLWVYPVVSTGNATIADIALDGYGNIFATGAFNQSINVGDEEMKLDDSNAGAAAIYVLKLTKEGKAVRAWQISALEATASSIAIDSKNNVIVAGLLGGDATFETGGELEGDFQNSAQYFIAKYANNGKHIWHEFRNDNGASNYTRPYVAVDANDQIYLASSITGATKILDQEIKCTVSNAFLLAYDADGKAQWLHLIKGDAADEAAAVAVSPIGQVAFAVNHHSGDLYLDDLAEAFNNGYAYDPSYAHTAIFAFDLKGEYKWYYDWGYSNGADGSDAVCHSIRCTNEGVWYVSGMMTGRYGGSRLPAEDRTLPNGKNSGVETIDHQWMTHNTNGGWDCYMLTLTRGGKLANVIRPGGTQYERGLDVALSPDKKSLYLLMQINVRNNVPYTCPDNLFDSFSDLYAPSGWESRKGKYTLLNVYCPENKGKSDNYGKDYKAVFASSMLVKYAMPELNPNQLPFFTANNAYSQKITMPNPKGKASIYQLEKYADVEFDGATVSGTFADEKDRYVGLIAIDSIALPGQITYYEYDKDFHRSVRSTPRNVRYMALTIEKAEPEEPVDPDTGKEGLESIQTAGSSRKFILDGILYIERNGSLFNAQGQVVR